MINGALQDGREGPAGPADGRYIVVLRHLRVDDASFRLGFLVDMEDTAKIYILLHLKTYELYSFN